ncbi:uncharacterized protein LOC126977231 [Leptidea sinapis]|uniref:uncharacterized protein LOC126977231 n=1 Tax=Leptidea sinapis TaxID=189913 RepID=UPI00213CD47C|nr:uncharacterized protein LOC126977231 [Leptidea sinapis]
MAILWLLVIAACLTASSCAERGGSLRGALEALQRRQRGRVHAPIVQDYDTLYEFVPPQNYPEPDYPVDVENVEEEPKYIVRLLDESERPVDDYEYKIIRKKNSVLQNSNKKQSTFRERSQISGNDKLRAIFYDKDEQPVEEEKTSGHPENDSEYALLLGQLWTKYNSKDSPNRVDDAPQGVVKLYKEKIVKKRYPDSWGPIAFKRKRSSDIETERPDRPENKPFEANIDSESPNYNTYDLSDDDKDDMREEYAIAFQPLDDDSLSDLADEDDSVYENIEKRFPVSKRSSGGINKNSQKKRFALNNRSNVKSFRTSSGTDPKVIADLAKIFGPSEYDIIKRPVKRSSNYETLNSHEVKPPMTVVNQNSSHEHAHDNESEDSSHEHHGHPPGVTGKEVEHPLQNHENYHQVKSISHNQNEFEKAKVIKKKSIDWSDYFGVDKRFKNAVPKDFNENSLKTLYFDKFNREVMYPSINLNKNNHQKRSNEGIKSFKSKENTEVPLHGEKRNPELNTETKLDNFDKKLKNMEGLMVDEALHYSNVGDKLDSKEEQEMKEKLLSRLAAAYSLEKMRKALKEFKQSLQIQKTPLARQSTSESDSKDKRVAVKKERVTMSNDIQQKLPHKGDTDSEDFEDEQGAGHYINGKLDEQLSEGYMGGSGRHRIPVISTASSSSGACPILAKIVQRCHGVDVLAGDRGQLFLPLCSLHQICYLCGEAPPTTCDLVFLSEADSTCDGDMSCQRAARSALMALRELHDTLADELDGECEANPCLPDTLKLNIGWQRALQR